MYFTECKLYLNTLSQSIIIYIRSSSVVKINREESYNESVIAGIEQGIEQGQLELITGFMKTQNITLERALELFDIPKEKWNDYSESIKKSQQ